MTTEQKESFHAAVMPLILWIAENMHPHAKAIVDSTGAELVEGIALVNETAHIEG